MDEHDSALYSAYASRDPRFDGVFFVGVTSTGIYCRPVCTAKTPKAANCRFFATAAAAEGARFRPCLRCRPERAPGNAIVDGRERVAGRIVQRIEDGRVEDGGGIEALAAEFHMSSRQLRRIVQRELGVSPIELVLTRRLLLAKQLLADTELPVIEIAHASGFSSLRRFNDAFRGRYGMPPSRLRKAASEGACAGPDETLTLSLGYRPPFDWAGLLRFFASRALSGVEAVGADGYARTVRLGSRKGVVRVRDAPETNEVKIGISLSLVPVLPALLGRVRHLFDLGARPDLIAEWLARDGLLARSVEASRGLRVPGAFDGFELAVRAILGQQITVKGASTLAGRYARAFGETFDTGDPGLTHLSPTPLRISTLHAADLVDLGIVRSRAESIIALAGEVAAGRLNLEMGGDPVGTREKLLALPGIGPWTAEYIAMRALGWPDAFPKEDVAVRKRLGGVSAAEAERMSERWKPWRSYATLHLWRIVPDAEATG